MRKYLCLISIFLIVLICAGCESNEEKCSKSFDCIQIENNSYRCNYCANGTKTCSSPSGVTCSSSND